MIRAACVIVPLDLIPSSRMLCVHRSRFHELLKDRIPNGGDKVIAVDGR